MSSLLSPDNFVNALSLGALYALIAVGYTMVYGIIKLINFAHGEIFMLGAFWALLLVGAEQATGMNLFRLEADGSAMRQLGFNTQFEGRASLMPDGRVLYTRWEYVDKHFAPAYGLWTVNPDGSPHLTRVLYGIDADKINPVQA